MEAATQLVLLLPLAVPQERTGTLVVPVAIRAQEVVLKVLVVRQEAQAGVWAMLVLQATEELAMLAAVEVVEEDTTEEAVEAGLEVAVVQATSLLGEPSLVTTIQAMVRVLLRSMQPQPLHPLPSPL